VCLERAPGEAPAFAYQAMEAQGLLVGAKVARVARSITDLTVKRTIVMTMVNGGAKYMADAESYDKITYAAMNSRYAKGAAELVSSRILQLLAGLR
jgi:hypothetical protein